MNKQHISVAAVRDADLFQKLADGAPLMIWMAGLDMGCFYFNRAWLDFRGRRLEEEFGNGWAEGVHPDDVQRCVAHYVECFEQRIAFAMNYRLKNSAGEYRWILDRGAPHYSSGGTFLGFFGGCAETDEQLPEQLNSKLRVSLADVEQFARRLAEENLNASAALNGSAPPLRNLLHDLRLARHERTREFAHAARQLEKLTADMVAFRKIPRGACLNDPKQASTDQPVPAGN